MLKEKKLKATLSFAIFILLLALLMTPVQVAFRQLALIEEKPVISAGGLEVTSTDIITIATLAAGSVALGTFFTEIIIPQAKKVGRR